MYETPEEAEAILAELPTEKEEINAG